MELTANESEYSIDYKEFSSNFHIIRARFDEDGVDAATRAMDAINNKKLSAEERENHKSMWIQKHMVIKYSKSIDGDQWFASFDALRKKIAGLTVAEATKEARKQTTLDQHTK